MRLKHLFAVLIVFLLAAGPARAGGTEGPGEKAQIKAADKLVAQGLKALDEGKPKKALELLQRSLTVNPNVLTPLKSRAADRLVRKGRALLVAEKPHEALAWLGTAANLNRFDPLAPFYLAQAHYKIAVRDAAKSEIDQAKACIRESLRRDDTFGQPYLLWGYISLALRDYQGAVNGFRGALQRGCQVRDSKAGLAQSLWFLGVETFKKVEAKTAPPEAPLPIFEEAADLLSSLKDDLAYSKKYRDNFHDLWIKSLVDLAETNRRAGNLAVAEQILLRLVKIAPDDYQNWFNLGLFYGQTLRYDKALKAYRKALEVSKDPHWIEPYPMMGFILSQQKKTKLAEKYLKAYVAARPDGWGGHFQLGSHYVDLAPDLAVVQFKRCIEIDPTALGGIQNLYKALMKAHRSKEAAKWLALYEEVETPDAESAKVPEAKHAGTQIDHRPTLKGE